MTTLADLVGVLDSLDEQATIYLAEPWQAASVALVAREPASGSVPPEARQQGLKYFLEVAVAQEFLEDWFKSLKTTPGVDEACRRLVQYAIQDA